MESDDEVLLSSSPSGASPPVRERKLKRLKKAIRASPDPELERSESGRLIVEENFSQLETLKFGELEDQLSSGSGSEEFDGGNALDSGSIARRALDFEALGEKADDNVEDRSKEIGEDCAEVTVEELGEKRRSPDRLEEDEDKKKKRKKRKKRIEGSGENEKSNEASANKWTEKERRDYLKQLHAESQRLLRETRDASFKPGPLVQKPISSVLEKIRRRKLEVSKKSFSVTSTSFIDDDDNDNEEDFLREVVNKNAEDTSVYEREDNRVSVASCKEKIARPAEAEDSINVLNGDESNDSNIPSCEKVPPMTVDEEPNQSFRAPIDDTQELFSDSQKSDLKNEAPSSPLEEVFVRSELVMNLQLDSAPPDDVSSDEEDYDKENVDPHPSGSADLSLSPKGDPVKAFVDDEAEEEEDSDNDLLRFKDNDEDEDDEDLEELNEMIATGYEEKPIDNERRNELHQQWLEQQDAAGTENLLQKLKYGSKHRETTLVEEEEDKEENEDDEFCNEDAEELAPTNLVRMNLRKVKQMIPQMFSDNDDAYLSDDEETEKRLAKECLLEKAEEQVSFLSPAEDESSKEVFGRIKKLNIIPDPKKRAKTHAYIDMPLMGVNRNISSKPSFLGRGSTHSLPSSKKQGSKSARSFIFERDDSNSRSAISASEDSSEAIQRENRPRVASVKFSYSQTKSLTQNSSPVMKSGTSLFDILKRTSLTSKPCTLDNTVTQTESILSSFKLVKKPVKPKEDR